jgi:cobalt-zinc-cadmium efflux system membrane fusion protein
VIQTQKKTIVFREIEKGKFVQTEVEVGKRSGDMLPVLAGLKPGDRVVIDGGILLRGY